LTRGLALALVPFLLTAGGLLYLAPGHTAEHFAWTIKPDLTPIVMGAGYLAGAYFFLRVGLTRDWAAVRLGFLPVTVFAWLSLAATLLHWDRFNHAHISFIAWITLYVLTPLLVPALWWLNRHIRAPEPAHSAPMPTLFSAWAGLVALVLLGLGVSLFLAPSAFIPVWPWTLTPLTARVIGSWFVLSGLNDASTALSRSWRGSRIILQTQLIGLALIILGLPRALGDLRPDYVWGSIFAGGMLMLCVIFGASYALLERRSRPVGLANPT
jgi:hypothetical protein